MRTGFITHSDCLYHDTPYGHPECPDRLRAIMHAVETEEFQYLIRDEAPLAEVETICLAHPRAYVDQVLASIPGEEDEPYHHFDADTVVSRGSKEAALRAVGAVKLAVDGVMTGTYDNAFCAVRPPGHHAEPTKAMGFCLFSNAAIAGLYARKAYNLTRVAVVDFDVHHGNGTQACFEHDGDCFYASTHQYPLYPGTGHPNERGIAGNILNVPLRAGAGSEDFAAAYTERVLPALRAFEPEIIVISAGFDAHWEDPLAQLRLRDRDFLWVTQELLRVGKEVCQGRVVSVLEGGYDLTALASSVAAHVRALMASD